MVGAALLVACSQEGTQTGGEGIPPLPPPLGFCGDGRLDHYYEQCEDNDRINGDGCSAECFIDGEWPPPVTGLPVPEHCVPAVTLADPVLEREVRKAVGRPEGELPHAEVSQLQVLAARDQPVTDLGGVECLTGLRSIALDNGSITDLEPLSGLWLVSLALTCHRLSDLTPLAGHLGMTYLDIRGNQITDLSPLSNMMALTALNAGDNRISDIAVLASLPRLGKIAVPGNLISALDQLAALKAFNLDVSRNSISDLSGLAELDGVVYFSSEGNGITSLDFLATWDPESWSGLVDLSLRNNAITDLTPLVSSSWFDNRAVLLEGNPIDCTTQGDNLATLRGRNIRIGSVCGVR
jgi:cysteine-rich repeat protein